ncbi:MAG: formimidoylglutamate deiminase [Parvularculaceae bacterium]
MRKLFFENALLPGGWARNVAVDIDAAGAIAAVEANADARGLAADGKIALPGLANLHSHAFQRAMAGLAEFRGDGEDDFWSWRTVMYRFAADLSPDQLQAIAAQAYAEMLESGFTAVGEFHYLHHQPDGRPYADRAEMAARLADGAVEAGVGLTLTPVFYAHGDFGGAPAHPEQRRFINDMDGFSKIMDGAARALSALPGAVLGVAAHSLRAVAPEELDGLLNAWLGGPVHIHAAEQTKEVEACRAWSGRRPVEWLLDHCKVDARWQLVHATHMTDAETDAVAQSGAVVGLCPITEANLGDGVFNGVRYCAAGGRWGVGSDSHIRIDAAEELRSFEYSQRLFSRARNAIAAPGASTGRTLFNAAASGGAQALGRKTGALVPGHDADIVALDAGHPVFAGGKDDQWLDGWIFAGGKDCVQSVWARGRKVVEGGRHIARERIVGRFRAAMKELCT